MRRWVLVCLLVVVAASVWAIPPAFFRGGFTYLLRDQFTTAASAPMASPRACEPGPGSWTVTDTENKISVSDGVLAFAGGKASPGWGDPMVRSEASVGSAGGTALLATVVSNTGPARIGFGAGTSNPGFRFSSSTLVAADAGSSSVNSEYLTLPQEFAVIIRPASAGGWMCRRSPGGTWNLQWVSAGGPNTNVVVSSYNSVATVDNVRVVVLPTWATESNIYTSFVATPANPQSATMTADGLVYVTWTPAAGETLELDIRRTDANNRWVHRCDQAGGTMKIIERNAGVETERGSSASTWTVGTAYRIGIVAVQQSIRQLVDNATKNTYTSASFNQTATGVYLAGHSTAANLYAWPRYVSIPGGV